MRTAAAILCLSLVLPASSQARSLRPAGSGDVNGDGRADVVVANYGATVKGRAQAGLVSVLYGGPSLRRVRRTAPGSHGFTVIGARAGDYLGSTTATIAGDVNGDRRDDVLVVAREGGTAERPGAGIAYVIFGGARPGETIDLADPLGARGFAILGPVSGSAMQSGAGVGDMDGDGLDDVVLGAFRASYDDSTSSWLVRDEFLGNFGAAWVVRGRRDAGATADLAQPDAAFLRVDGWTIGDLGAYVAGPGDVNADGIPDLAIDAYQPVVVFGSRAGGVLKASTLGARGFRITGLDEDSAHDVAAVGDVNRDGRADVLAGDLYTGGETEGPGAMYVLRGKPSSASVNVDRIGNGGLDVRLGNSDGSFGDGVAGVGDFDGNGRPDACSGSWELGDVGIELRANRTGRRKLSGLRVRSSLNDIFCLPTGDVNGDGLDDVVVKYAAVGDSRFWVILGQRHARGSVRLGRLGRRGFELRP